jgi:Kyakuja-Dileera-Zisupton transposase
VRDFHNICDILVSFGQVEIEAEGDPEDGNPGQTTCTNRWRAAMADTLKGSYNSFHETGVFVSVCHHGFVWTIADMIHSGEL